MTLAIAITSADWFTLGARVVGATFIWAGAIKAIAPHTFKNHLRSLGWIPENVLTPAVTLAAGLEVGWGVSLATGAAPAFVYPATVALLVVLTTFSWLGVRSGKAKDCGCYGGFIQPSITQSIALNGTFAALVVVAWLAGNPTMALNTWQVAAILVGSLGAAGLAGAAQRFESKNGRLMFDTSPLKVGGRWSHAWAAGQTAHIDGEVMVAYLGPSCPYCSQFVKVANVIVQSPDLPRVVGVIAGSEEQIKTYVADQGIRFPVARLSQSLMSRLTTAVPTTVIINSGKIETMWVGNMPPQFVDRFRDAFFPDIAKKAAELTA